MAFLFPSNLIPSAIYCCNLRERSGKCSIIIRELKVNNAYLRPIAGNKGTISRQINISINRSRREYKFANAQSRSGNPIDSNLPVVVQHEIYFAKSCVAFEVQYTCMQTVTRTHTHAQTYIVTHTHNDIWVYTICRNNDDVMLKA